ncbi:MAG TPA: zinc ribbon domain-containing protein [Lichenihabitans sp.]|jgi:hypothetical protein|nr:zinc ribbon domain-containing protein [Lichenihabitans sp.]
MSDQDVRRPPAAVFSPDGTAALPNHPALLGGRCEACGHAFFPMQTYGCEKCGSQNLKAVSLSGKGRLIACAEVFISANKHHPAPYTIGSIVTDDGAVVRSILDVPPGARLTPGAVMVTRLVPETRPDRGSQDLRFAPATVGEA